jgi:uncharacterized protein (DUF58 family)
VLETARAYSNLELLARQQVEGFITGLHKSPYHGFSVEFAEHKAYNPGQSLRHIDWKLFGRTDRLYTRTYEEETNLRCQLVIDVSGSMYYPRPAYDKLRFAATAAASLAWMLHRQRDAVGLALASNALLEQTRIKSTMAHLQSIFSMLELRLAAPAPAVEKSNSPTTFLAPALHQLAEQLGQRALVVLFTDALEADNGQALFESLQHLRHNKHEVILFHTVHGQTEDLLNLPDRPTTLVDAETGQTLKLNPYTIRQEYRNATQARLETLRLHCAQNRIDLVEARVELGINPILQAYLAKRARMR